MEYADDAIVKGPLLRVSDLKGIIEGLNPELPVSVSGADPARTLVLIDRKRGVLLIDQRQTYVNRDRPTASVRSRRVWGSSLLALGYFVAGHAPLLSLVHGDPAAAGGMAPGFALVVVALVAIEILIALISLRRGERWAFWAAVVPVVIIAIPRMLNDPACIAMSLSMHGCHQFMGGLLLAVIGLVLAFPKRAHQPAQAAP